MRNSLYRFRYLWPGLFFCVFSVSYTHADEYITDDSLRSLLQTSIEHQLSDPERSLSLAALALESGAATRLPELLPDLHLLIAHNYYDLTQMDSAILHYQQVTLLTTDNNPEQLCRAFNGLANCNYYMGDNENAWRYYEKSLEIATEHGISTALPTLYNNLGNIFMDQNADEKALEYYQKGYDFATDTLHKAHFSNNVGLVYQKIDSLDKALSWYEKSKALYDQIGEKRFSLTPLYNIALIQFDKQDYDNALRMYRKLTEQCLELNLKEDLIHIYNRVGLIHNLQGKHDTALHYHKKCLDLAKETSFRLIGTYYSDLAKTYDSLGNYRQALHYLKKYNALNDSLNSHEKEKLVSEMITRYEAREKIAEISRLEMERRNLAIKARQEAFIRYVVVVVASMVLGLLIAFLFIYRKKIALERQMAAHKKETRKKQDAAQKHRNEMEMMKVSIAAQEKEKQRIASQLHDSVAGTLAGVKQRLSNLPPTSNGNHEFKLAHKYIDSAYREVSTLSESLSSLSISQSPFIPFIKNYCREVSELNGLKITVGIDWEDEMDVTNKKAKLELFRIIQEALNNIVKHARATHVNVDISKKESLLVLTIKDNGKGFENSGTVGIGLKSMKQRADMMGGTMKLDTSPGKGTKISIEVPGELWKS